MFSLVHLMTYKMQRKLFHISTRLLLLIGLFGVNIPISAQNKIDVFFPERADSISILARHFDGKLLVADTLEFDSKGKVSITKPLSPGLYALIHPKRKQYDFLIGNDQNMKLSIKNRQLNIENSEEGKAFQYYLMFLRKQQVEKGKLIRSLKQQKGVNKQSVHGQIDSLDHSIRQLWDELESKHPNSMLSTFIDLSRELKIPKSNKSISDSLKWINNYHYMTQNFWSHINLKDERILNTPLLKNKLDIFFNKVIIQVPDTMTKEAFRLLDACGSKTFPYISNYLMNNALNTKFMGMEAAFVAIAEKYFIGQKTWADSATMYKIKQQVALNKPNLLGNKAPNLKLKTPENEFRSLYDVNASFTILLFWETSCGHCKTEIPKLLKLWNTQKEKGIKIFAVYTQDKKKVWTDYIFDKKIFEWINVYDEDRLSPFRQLYNIYSTPTIYLLDKNKKIIAKRMSVDNLEKILEREFKQLKR
ncbi:TlpA family protein disulfide reductase [Prolixibacteraceae bacterium JC049]|nr:TlpA family protein disulfide reductase [Prolixibacteraceae bacterium JC049]